MKPSYHRSIFLACTALDIAKILGYDEMFCRNVFYYASLIHLGSYYDGCSEDEFYLSIGKGDVAHYLLNFKNPKAIEVDPYMGVMSLADALIDMKGCFRNVSSQLRNGYLTRSRVDALRSYYLPKLDGTVYYAYLHN